jgi:Flp pilus assembly protein TadG
MRARGRAGNAMLEFTLVGIPLIFFLISVVEMARGMWIYATVEHAVKEGTRFAAVHGAACAQASSQCPVSLGSVAATVEQAAVGLDPGQFNLTLSAGGATQTCAPLSSCLTSTSTWPPTSNNAVGLPLKITGTYPFNSALCMFWPGASPTRFAGFNLGAESQEEISF